MELPVQFVYTENGIKKTSVDENKRMNYIGQINRELLKSNLNSKRITKE